MKCTQAALLSLSLIIGLPTLTVATDGQRVERGNLILENVPAIPPELAAEVAGWQEGSEARFRDWSSDGKAMLVVAQAGRLAQVHLVANALGTPRPLTASPTGVSSSSSGSSAVAQPGGSGFVYMKDENGDEFFQLYFHNINTGKETLITDGGKSRNIGALWSKDGKQLSYVHIPPGTKRYQIRIADAANPTQSKTLLDREDDFTVEDWSQDAKTLLVRRYVSKNESYLYTLSVTGGELHQINPQRPGAATIAYGGGRYSVSVVPGGPRGGARFSPDGRFIYALSDQNNDFDRLVRFDMASGKQVVLTEGLKWGVEGFELSHNGKTIVYAVNQDGISNLHALNTENNQVSDLPALPPGMIEIGGFDGQDKQFAFTFLSAAAPADVYVWSLGENKIARWTQSHAAPGIKPEVLAALARPELIHFKSFDGQEVSAVLYRPQREGKFPVVIHFHGGPESQTRPTYPIEPHDPFVAGLTLGFAVIAPNVRGSTGYGKAFLAADNGMKREDSVKDAGALLDWIDRQGFLDNTRVAIVGGSYGGYMVNATAMHYAKRLKGVISIVAISDFNSYFRHTAEYRRDTRRAEYGDERDPKMAAFFKSISVLEHVDQLTVPFFIVHGLNDPRVPVQEAEQLFAALQKTGAEPWLMLFKDEGHGVSKRANIQKLGEGMTLFLQKVVLEGGK
jgi:dipeptidyl aminopeptidase/acylaminoacyl peptidase